MAPSPTRRLAVVLSALAIALLCPAAALAQDAAAAARTQEQERGAESAPPATAAGVAAGRAQDADALSLQRRAPAQVGRGSGGFLGALDELFAPADLLGDLGHMVTAPGAGDLLILGGGFGLSVASMQGGADTTFFNGHEPHLGAIGDTMTFLGRRTALYPALVGTFAVGKLLHSPGVSGTAAEMTQAVLLTDLIVGPLKQAAGRLRPDGNGNSSYPSGHTAAAFAVATVLQRRFGTEIGASAYAVAVLMGASRVDQRRHFLSDVVAGAAIGIVAAHTVGRRFGSTDITLHPVLGDAGGSGLGFTIRF